MTRLMGPVYVLVSWLKGTQDVVNTGRAHKTVRDNLHSVVIHSAQITDSGTYTVEAKNISGSVRAYCSVKVSFYLPHVPAFLLCPAECCPDLFCFLSPSALLKTKWSLFYCVIS